MKDIKKNVGVKREMRTNSESEPTKVYQPRTLKARPVSTSNDNVDKGAEAESSESTPLVSEKPIRKTSDDSTTKKSIKKSDEVANERKSTYTPRTGNFKKSNEDFSADIERSSESTSVNRKSEPAEQRKIEKTSFEKNAESTVKRKIEIPLKVRKEDSSEKTFSRDRNTDDRPFRKKEDRFGAKKDEPRKTSRSIEGKSTGYISSRIVKDRDSRGERDENSRRPRTSNDDRIRLGDRTKDRKPYTPKPETDKNAKLRLVLPTSGEKVYIDKPIAKPKREYDDKPYLEVDSDGLIRLNKYISNTGLCSRREADEFIQNGMITVNGEVISQVGTKVDPTSEVCFRGKKLETEHKVYILLNKPKDYITTVEDPNAKRTVMELIEGACTERVYPVGRLDRNSTGLLLLTNDGEMTKKLTHPSHMKKKIYHVGLDKALTREDMEKMIAGVELDGELVKADAVEYTEDSDGTEVGVEIHTGQNRVVRNMFDALGYKVSRLDRVYFAGLTKKNLPRGRWRFLTQLEINMLKMNRFE
ncbi:MAG: rRNA pseudouridine synthase [Bacteroidales bacterium]|nr:MAG: rRNA pseudouridine synthase [Bacteroidales bacterium]